MKVRVGFFVVEVLGKIGSENDRHHLMEILLLQNILKGPISLLASTEVSTFNMTDYLRYKHHLYRNVFDRDFSGNYFNAKQLLGSVRGIQTLIATLSLLYVIITMAWVLDIE